MSFGPTSDEMSTMSAPTNPADVHLLVIDNDAIIQDAAAGAAGRLGIFQILCCDTAAEAVNKMDRFAPNVILAEPRLGGAATVNFVRRIRAGQTSVKTDCLVLFASRDWSGGLERPRHAGHRQAGRSRRFVRDG